MNRTGIYSGIVASLSMKRGAVAVKFNHQMSSSIGMSGEKSALFYGVTDRFDCLLPINVDVS